MLIVEAGKHVMKRIISSQLNRSGTGITEQNNIISQLKANNKTTKLRSSEFPHEYFEIFCAVRGGKNVCLHFV